jgi:hypothetical protein
MAVEFYDVKTREKVKIDDKKVSKTTFTGDNGQVRYGLRGETADGRKLTKFVSKGDWDGMNVPVEAEKKKEKKDTKDAKDTKKAAPKKK